MRERSYTTRNDAGSIRVHDQLDERPGAALMLPKGFGDCSNHVHMFAATKKCA